MRSYTSKKPPSEMRNTSIQRCRVAGRRSMRADSEAAACLQFAHRLAVTRQALCEHLVVDVVRGGHQRYAGQREPVDGVEDVVAQQRDVLDAFAIELHQELLDLPGALLRFLVEGDAD